VEGKSWVLGAKENSSRESAPGVEVRYEICKFICKGKDLWWYLIF